MFEHIVVPLDGTPRAEVAVSLASRLARRTGADLVIVSTSRSSLDRYAYIEKIVADLEVEASIEVSASEHPAEVIRRRQIEHAPALVVMATHGRRPIGAAVLGSVGTQVVRRGCGPIMLVGPRYVDQPTVPNQIVVPLDGSAHSETALPVAGALSTQLGAPLHLVRVIDPDEDLSEQWPDSALTLASTYLATAARTQKVTSWELLYDPHPPAGIASAVSAQPGAPVVVMATHGRGRGALAIMGSVATSLVHRATFPVVLIRPAGLDRSR